MQVISMLRNNSNNNSINHDNDYSEQHITNDTDIVRNASSDNSTSGNGSHSRNDNNDNNDTTRNHSNTSNNNKDLQLTFACAALPPGAGGAPGGRVL